MRVVACGDIADFDLEGHSFTVLDPTGVMGELVREYPEPGSVDIVLGNELVTCASCFLVPVAAGRVRVSARTSEVGNPIPVDGLTKLIVERSAIGSDPSRWLDEIRRSFPNAGI